MMKNGIYFYKAGFPEYSKYCTGVMPEYPEDCNDDHTCATFVFDKKEGFIQSNEGLIIARKIRQNCIEIGRIIAYPRNDEIKSAISDYNEFALKKINTTLFLDTEKLKSRGVTFWLTLWGIKFWITQVMSFLSKIHTL